MYRMNILLFHILLVFLALQICYINCSEQLSVRFFFQTSCLAPFKQYVDCRNLLQLMHYLCYFIAANHCIRVHPGRHFTCGFFVAVFQRKDPSTMYPPKGTDALCRQNLPIPCSTHKTQLKSSKANRRRKYKPIKSLRQFQLVTKSHWTVTTFHDFFTVIQ